jgi:hypothetical protein
MEQTMTAEPLLEPTGLDANLSEEEFVIQEDIHYFSKAVIRYTGTALAKLLPEEFLVPDSHAFLFHFY